MYTLVPFHNLILCFPIVKKNGYCVFPENPSLFFHTKTHTNIHTCVNFLNYQSSFQGFSVYSFLLLFSAQYFCAKTCGETLRGAVNKIFKRFPPNLPPRNKTWYDSIRYTRYTFWIILNLTVNFVYNWRGRENIHTRKKKELHRRFNKLSYNSLRVYNMYEEFSSSGFSLTFATSNFSD